MVVIHGRPYFMAAAAILVIATAMLVASLLPAAFAQSTSTIVTTPISQTVTNASTSITIPAGVNRSRVLQICMQNGTATADLFAGFLAPATTTGLMRPPRQSGDICFPATLVSGHYLEAPADLRAISSGVDISMVGTITWVR